MAVSHPVTLTLGSTGRVIDVWDGYQITLSMLSVGQSWTFSFWRSDTRESTWDVLLDEVKAYDWIELRIGGALQLNGLIESIDMQDERGSGTALVIGGRDLAGDAQDWDADPRISLRNQSLETVLQRALAPLGIPVEIGADADEARRVQQNIRPASGRRRVTKKPRKNLVDLFHPKPGERIWQLVDRTCRKVGLLPWVAPVGGNTLAVIVDAPLTTGSPSYSLRRHLDARGRVQVESNILRAHRSINTRGVPSQVTVCAQTPRGDGTPGKFLSTVINGRLAANPFVRGDGPVHERFIRSERAYTADSSRREAERSVAEANAHLDVYRCTMQGHAEADDSPLYALNSIAHVRDDLYRVDDDMLITEVKFTGARGQGSLTELTLAPLGAIEIIPEADA